MRSARPTSDLAVVTKRPARKSTFTTLEIFCTVEVSVTRSVIVVNPQGFHARPAHQFVKLAGTFPCVVEIIKGNEVINGKSILDLLTLGAGNGTTLTLRASGQSADEAIEALARLIEGGFGEMTPAEGSA